MAKEAPKEKALDQRFAALVRQYPNLPCELKGTELRLFPKGKDAEVVVEPQEDGRWITFTKDWHGHYKNVDLAIATALDLVAGFARTAKELREDKLSATWLEFWEEGAYTAENMAFFLNPFDKDEWELIPGEHWRVLRTHRHLIDLPGMDPTDESIPPLGETKVFERDAEESIIMGTSGTMLTALETEFGSPVEGMRWTYGSRNTFILQVPSGWRLQEEKDAPKFESLFAPKESPLALRIRTAFRSLEEPLDAEEMQEPVLPRSIEYFGPEPTPEDSNWTFQYWDVYFTGPSEEMLARVTLLYNRSAGLDNGGYRSLFEESLKVSRYVP